MLILQLIAAFTGLISFIILDYIWLAHIAKKLYLSSLQDITVIENGSLVPYLPAIPFVYIVALFGLFFFVPSITNPTSSLATVWYTSAIFGFVLYAFYDFTNLATLKNYPFSLTVIDIIWGTFLVSSVACIMTLVVRSLIK